MRFKVTDLPLSGLKLIERDPIVDQRGSFSRIFCGSELSAFGWSKPIAQINHSITTQKGTVRGLHFQYSPFCEMKLVSGLRGEVWDVTVDLRKDSPTFLKWHAEMLSGTNKRALLIPEGFAHGFQSLSDDVELLYLHSQSYQKDAEGGVNPLDPKLAITWPLPISEISERDSGHAMISGSFEGIKL